MSFKKNTNINELTESKRLVSTEIVKLEKNIISVPVYGKLFSLKEINIVAEANGIFYGNKFKTGMKFSKGDTLGYIKYDEIESNLNSQKSNLLNQTSKIVSEIKFDFPDSYQSWFNFMNKISFNDPISEVNGFPIRFAKKLVQNKDVFIAMIIYFVMAVVFAFVFLLSDWRIRDSIVKSQVNQIIVIFIGFILLIPLVVFIKELFNDLGYYINSSWEIFIAFLIGLLVFFIATKLKFDRIIEKP